MTKMVFGGKFSMTGGGTMTKEDLTLEDTLLHCDACKADTMHSYKRMKEQKQKLTFVYRCIICGEEHYSDIRV